MPALSQSGLSELVAPVVEAQGYDLEDLTVSPAGRRSVVRVVVDRDGGVDLDAVADLSRAISGALDGSDRVGDAPYVLEVSSPGVDRPLTEPRHWRRNVGRVVATPAGTGRVLDVSDAGVRLDVDGESRDLGYDAVRGGTVVVEFRPLASAPDSSGHDASGHDASGQDPL
jgi:ribosome maturation factor RimP